MDGAIRRAVGPRLLEECRKLGGCPTREARVTRCYNLPARWVIHTIGPVWQGGAAREPELFASCYRNSLRLAEEYGVKTIAFPAISAGVYGYPMEQAARVAVTEVSNHLAAGSAIEKVLLVCFNERPWTAYQDAFAMLRQGHA